MKPFFCVTKSYHSRSRNPKERFMCFVAGFTATSDPTAVQIKDVRDEEPELFTRGG